MIIRSVRIGLCNDVMVVKWIGRGSCGSFELILLMEDRHGRGNVYGQVNVHKQCMCLV
jgi:hypothetical protein